MKLKRLNLLKKIKSSGWHAHEFFASNVWKGGDDGHSDNFFDDLKTPLVITFGSCDIKPASFLNIRQKIKVLKSS